MVLACLVSQGGCARYRDWVWNTSGARPSRAAADDLAQEPIDSLNIKQEADNAVASGQGPPDPRTHR